MTPLFTLLGVDNGFLFTAGGPIYLLLAPPGGGDFGLWVMLLVIGLELIPSTVDAAISPHLLAHSSVVAWG